MTGPWDR